MWKNNSRANKTAVFHTLVPGVRNACIGYGIDEALTQYLAHRTLIARQLKGLEEIIPYTSVHWEMLEKGESSFPIQALRSTCSIVIMQDGGSPLQKIRTVPATAHQIRLRVTRIIHIYAISISRTTKTMRGVSQYLLFMI